MRKRQFFARKKKSAARVNSPKSHRLGMGRREGFKTSTAALPSASVSDSNDDPSQARGDQR
jgi:hypothetical protein